jgi:hypothetical protein
VTKNAWSGSGPVIPPRARRLRVAIPTISGVRVPTGSSSALFLLDDQG